MLRREDLELYLGLGVLQLGRLQLAVIPLELVVTPLEGLDLRVTRVHLQLKRHLRYPEALDFLVLSLEFEPQVLDFVVRLQPIAPRILGPVRGSLTPPLSPLVTAPD